LVWVCYDCKNCNGVRWCEPDM